MYAEKAWAFVRKAKQPFTSWDLARIAQVPYYYARRYIYYLTKAGYIKQVGYIKNQKLYRTIKVTGIKPVEINHHKKQVVDYNTLKEYKVEETEKTYKTIWNFIMQNHIVTVSQVHASTGISRDTIRHYLVSLERNGYLESTRKSKAKEYRLTTPQQIAPIFKRIPGDTQNTKTEKSQKIWDYIRVNETFTVKEISQTLQIHPKFVRTYLYHLRNSGYLQAQKTKDGYIYKLIRNSGTIAPLVTITRKKEAYVYDRNKNKKYPSIGDNHD